MTVPRLCPDCAALPDAAHHPGCRLAQPGTAHRVRVAIADVHRARIDLAVVQLRNLLIAEADDRCAPPTDAQLLAALERWQAGELI